MLCLSLRALGRNLLSVTFPYPRLLPHVTLLAFLLVSNLSPYHLSTAVLLSGSAACGTESKVSFLFPFFPYLFIYSFPVLSSPSLQLLSLGAFGTQDSPCLPCVPICVLIQPIFSPFSYSILLSYSFYSLCCCFCLGFRTFRCFGAINITESIIYVPSVTLLQCSSFHSLLSLPVTVILPGCFWAQDTLRGARWQRILLASHLFPYLSPCLFPTCLLTSLSPLRFFSLGAFGQRNLLVSRSSLLSPLLSVLRSGGFGDRTQVPSVFVLVSLLHSHMWLFSLGASGAQYAPCPLSVYVLVPLVLSNSCPYFSLSLAVLLSRCLFGHMILSGSSLVLPCSLQRVSLIPSSLLLLLGKERISWPLVFLLNFSSFVQVTFPYPRSLPHVTLLTFLRVSNLSPYSLSTTVLLSRSPAFGRRRELLSSFLSFITCCSSLSHCLLHFSPHYRCSL